ncbi:chemotaxis protein CheB [Pedobacter yulinensis]|uniref:chemotaxis protein CheB n=1 Tax=Pedobacter yulinensis TaxID=2126353 RepID=UPI000D154395
MGYQSRPAGISCWCFNDRIFLAVLLKLRTQRLTDNSIRISKAPRENGFRPSLDTLFRSAACHLPAQAIGVVLSGMARTD